MAPSQSCKAVNGPAKHRCSTTTAVAGSAAGASGSDNLCGCWSETGHAKGRPLQCTVQRDSCIAQPIKLTGGDLMRRNYVEGLSCASQEATAGLVVFITFVASSAFIQFQCNSARCVLLFGIRGIRRAQAPQQEPCVDCVLHMSPRILHCGDRRRLPYPPTALRLH